MSWSFEAQFLGSSTLSRQSSATGLGNIIQPLTSLYAASYEPKTGLPRPLPIRRLTLTDRGVIVTSVDLVVKTAPDERDTFYSMPSVLLWEAVRFAAVRGNSKKFRGGFEPIDERRLASSKEGLYIDLDKHANHLVTTVKQAHPVLFALVVRRPTGVKALELQVYSCGTAEHGALLVEQFTAAQNSYKAQQTTGSNVFNYNAFERSDKTTLNGGLQAVENRVPAAAAAGSMSSSPDNSELMHRLQKSSPLSTQQQYRSGLVAQEPGGDRRQAPPPASYVQSCFDLRAPSAGQFVNKKQTTAKPGDVRTETAASENRLLARDDRVQSFSSQLVLPLTSSSSNRTSVSGPGYGGRQLGVGRGGGGGGLQPVASTAGDQSVGSGAGGALEGYYDMPPAVQLPRVQSDVGSRLRQSQQQQQQLEQVAQLGRSKTFNGASPSKPADNGSVLHRSLIIQQQIADEDEGAFAQQTGGSMSLASGSDGTQPQAVVDRRMFRSQTALQVASKSSDRRTMFGPVAGDNSQQQQQQQQQVRQSAVFPSRSNQLTTALDASGVDESAFFMFGFKEARQAVQEHDSSGSLDVDGRRSAGYSVDCKPTAMVQPRKVPGVRVFPGNSKPAVTGSSSAAAEAKKTSPTVDGREPNAAVAGAPSADAKTKKDEGILNLRVTRSQPQQQQQQQQQTPRSAATDFNGNDVKQAPNKLSPNTHSALRFTASTGAIGSDARRSASGSSPLPQHRQTTSAVSGPQARQQTTTTGAAEAGDSGGPRDLTQKDREIASAIGDMDINYEPSQGTLRMQGSNMEKYLGYLP